MSAKLACTPVTFGEGETLEMKKKRGAFILFPSPFLFSSLLPHPPSVCLFEICQCRIIQNEIVALQSNLVSEK